MKGITVKELCKLSPLETQKMVVGDVFEQITIFNDISELQEYLQDSYVEYFDIKQIEHTRMLIIKLSKVVTEKEYERPF